MNDCTNDFDHQLDIHGLFPLQRGQTRTVQVNVGKLCNQACHHCHVEAGPKRTEVMSEDTATAITGLLANSPSVQTVDLTGGAPEMNPSFRFLVERSRELEKQVVVRCNLTVLFEPGMEWLPQFYVEQGVELACSLPCYSAENVDQQRGKGVFDKSIEALRQLGDLGFGHPDTGLTLNLVYNPTGASLPPDQTELELKYREELDRLFGIHFNHLFTITNMPIKRFADMLARSGGHEAYMALLVNHFNATAAGELMCRDLVSVGWEGSLYDCDFNQMLEIPLLGQSRSGTSGRALRLEDLSSFDDLTGGRVSTESHCFGCTAGSGSSCGGALSGRL